MQTPTNQAGASVRDGNTPAEPLHMCKQIGSTVYEVRVHFNQDTKETVNDKILRLILGKTEVAG